MNSFHARSRDTRPEADYAQNPFLGNLGAPLKNTYEDDEDFEEENKIEVQPGIENEGHEDCQEMNVLNEAALNCQICSEPDVESGVCQASMGPEAADRIYTAYLEDTLVYFMDPSG